MNHQFIVIVSGRHDPDDRKLFCYKVKCECGWKELADNYDDACELRAEHRKVRVKAGKVKAPSPIKETKVKKKRVVY